MVDLTPLQFLFVSLICGTLYVITTNWLPTSHILLDAFFITYAHRMIEGIQFICLHLITVTIINYQDKS